MAAGDFWDYGTRKSASGELYVTMDSTDVNSVAISTPGLGALGIFSQINPWGSLKVSVEPGALFVDQFDGVTVDTTNRWSVGGTAPTQASGNFTLNGGTTANATSVAVSRPTFAPPGLGFRIIGTAITLNATKVVNQNTHYFFGVGQVTSYAIGTPLTDGIGFEVDTTGELNCVVWVAGTRYVINSTNAALITAQASLPTGGVSSTFGNVMAYPTAGPHIYGIADRGDTMFFYIDSFDVPVAYCKNVQPQAQALPIRVAKINAAASVVASSFVTSGIVLGDSTSQNTTVSDSTFQWRRQTISALGAASATSPGKLANTFSASIAMVAAASATDIIVISGNASKTAYVTKISISGTQTVAGTVEVNLIKRAIANTGGTSVPLNIIPHDSSDSVAQSIVLSYSANPTINSTLGAVRKVLLPLSTAAGILSSVYEFSFGERSKEVTLRGVAEQLAVNLSGVTVTGNVFDVSVEWFEI